MPAITRMLLPIMQKRIIHITTVTVTTATNTRRNSYLQATADSVRPWLLFFYLYVFLQLMALRRVPISFRALS